MEESAIAAPAMARLGHMNGLATAAAPSTAAAAWCAVRAIATAAQAHIEDTRRAQGTLPAGLGKGDRVLESVGLRTSDHWQAMRHAIADVKNRMRETVTLI